MVILNATKLRLKNVSRTNWIIAVAIVWAGWLTYTVCALRGDVDAVYSEVSVVKSTVDDQDVSDQLEKIQQTLSRIDRRLP